MYCNKRENEKSKYSLREIGLSTLYYILKPNYMLPWGRSGGILMEKANDKLSIKNVQVDVY